MKGPWSTGCRTALSWGPRRSLSGRVATKRRYAKHPGAAVIAAEGRHVPLRRIEDRLGRQEDRIERPEGDREHHVERQHEEQQQPDRRRRGERRPEPAGEPAPPAGLGGAACGNYGVPFAEIVLQDQPPAAVALELSSFQLETIRTLHPEVAIWLNFAPDHMDRYPTVAAYRAAKLRVFETQPAGDTAMVRAGEEWPPLAARRIDRGSTGLYL